MENDNKTSLSPERIFLFEQEITKKKKNKKSNFIFRTVFFSVVLIAICLIPFLPTFSCRNLYVSGNFLLTNSEILSFAGYRVDTPLVFVDEKKIENSLTSKEYILRAEVNWSIMGLEINIDELAVLLLDYNEDYILSDGSYLSEFKAKYPESKYDFFNNPSNKAIKRHIPRLLCDFSFSNTENSEDVAMSKRLRVLDNLKKVSPEVLNDVDYFEGVYSSDNVLLFAFYFKANKGDSVSYYRILMKDETFQFFLEEIRIQQIISQITNFSDKKTYEHDTINELSYSNTICGYNGKQNVCRTM